MFIFAALSAVAGTVLMLTNDPPELVEVKRRYKFLRDYIQHNDSVPSKFKVLVKPIVIVGYRNKKHDLGYNTNKGYEIGLCLDGTPNQIFHVLLHELSHSTVREYAHNSEFWANFKELRELSTKIGLYEPIPKSQPFCGKHIHDT
jgi:hypothetical protein